MNTKRNGSNDKDRFLRLLAGLSLWFSLALFIMVSVSLRRFTTPAAPFSLAEEAPAATAAPAATTDPSTALPRVVNASRLAQHASGPSGPANADKAGPAELNPAPQKPRQKLRDSEARNPLPGRSSYFIGSDSQKWRTDAPTYAKVRYESVYPDVDLVHNK